MMADTFFDDIAVYCGDREFYDLDGDGHIDAIEGGFMLADVDDELAEIEKTSPLHTSTKRVPTSRSETNTWIVLIWGIIVPIYVVIHLLCN